MIAGIPARDYIANKARILPFLQGFVDRSSGKWTLFDVERDILESNRQVWSINDFQALGMTSVGPETVHIDACAGVRRHEWQEEFDEVIRDWARALGKKRIIANVRPGWARWGKTRGYREAHREMILEL